MLDFHLVSLPADSIFPPSLSVDFFNMLESEAKVEVDHGTDDDDGAVDGDDERWEDKEVAIPRYSNNEMDDEDADRDEDEREESDQVDEVTTISSSNTPGKKKKNTSKVSEECCITFRKEF